MVAPPPKFRALPSATGLEWGRWIYLRFAATSPGADLRFNHWLLGGYVLEPKR